MRILVVDDEKGFTGILRDNLALEHFEVDCAARGRAALDQLKARRYDLVILDVMMPDLDGYGVLREMRRQGDRTPVIFLTARAADRDKLHGLDTGADDYVTKPFSMAELLARVRSVLRRTTPGSELASLAIGPHRVDFQRLQVETDGAVISLSRYEAALLRLLASEPGRVFSRDEILDRVWGVDAFPTNRTVDNYIVRLRKKLEPDPAEPIYIQSVYGSGYKLAPPPGNP